MAKVADETIAKPVVAVCAAEQYILVFWKRNWVENILEMVHSVLDLVHVSDSRLNWRQACWNW